MKNIIFIMCVVLTQSLLAQTEEENITKTLTKYIDGSTGGKPNLLKEAFHPDLYLYYVKDNKVSTWSGTAYIADTKEGKPTGESGTILSIDYTNDAAVAKVEITSPGKTPYIDYFMLLKTEGNWTIIHKMFTKKINNSNPPYEIHEEYWNRFTSFNGSKPASTRR